jgi:membrane protease subunit HflC
MGTRTFSAVLVLALLALLVARSLFTVGESELAVRTEFGAIVGTGYAPGLHLKWPVDEVVKFDRRILSQTYQGETFLTDDNRGLLVDFYVNWRVADAPAYFRATGGREDMASARLAEIVKDGIKSVVAQHTLEQIVSSERAAVTSQMFGPASQRVAALGIKLVDVRMQRIDLPEEVASRVYESMKENFNKTASRLRAEGLSQAATIRASAERRRMEILSSAQADALKVRGESDAEAARIYAQAYSKSPEFYAFYRALQAYRNSLGKEGDLLVLSPDGEFFKYLKAPGGAAQPPAK